MPLAVLIQKPDCRTVYRIDDFQAYFDEVFTIRIGKLIKRKKLYPFPTVDAVEAGCKKYGVVVCDDPSFKKIRVFPAQSGYHGNDYFWELYRADFGNTMKS